ARRCARSRSLQRSCLHLDGRLDIEQHGSEGGARAHAARRIAIRSGAGHPRLAAARSAAASTSDRRIRHDLAHDLPSSFPTRGTVGVVTVLDVAIVGGGVVGLLCALDLTARGHRCTLFDAPGPTAPCSPRGGGMLAPISELDQAEPEIAFLGLDAPARWGAILGDAQAGTTWARGGSLLLAHRPEWPLLAQLQQRARAAGLGDRIEELDAARITALEPWTAGRFRRGLFLPGEGVVHPATLLPTLQAMAAARGVALRPVRVEAIAAGGVRADGSEHRADQVVDCRGL